MLAPHYESVKNSQARCCQQIELSGLLANELSGFSHSQVGKELDT